LTAAAVVGPSSQMDHPSAAIAVHLRSVVSSSLISDSKKREEKKVSVHYAKAKWRYEDVRGKTSGECQLKKKKNAGSKRCHDGKKVKGKGCVSSLQKPRDKKRTQTNRRTTKKRKKKKSSKNKKYTPFHSYSAMIIPFPQDRVPFSAHSAYSAG
jgi:hypothetical protein